jgi:predicted enzyme related to lactoylglutathione lyase
MIKKVGMLILMEMDIAKAVEFYEKLGLKLVFHLKEKWAELRLGDIKFGLCPASTTQDGHTGIVLEVEDMDATYNHLKNQGIEFINEPVEAAHGIMVSVKDPSGNILDLYQPTPEKIAQLIQESSQSVEQQCCRDSQERCCKKK